MHERRIDGRGLDGVLVNPGEIAVAVDGTTLVSVASLGVVVCLWSPSPPVAGMAHVVEPRAGDPTRSTPRFADAALPELVRMVRERGAGELEAQLLGGACLADGDRRGDENCRAASSILRRLGIPVASTDIGGTKGRKVVFDGASGQVAVVKVHSLRREDWNP